MQLRDDRERFGRTGANVVLVGLGTPERARRFRADKSIPWPCLADPRKEAYRAYGVRRGTPLEVFGPQHALRYLRANLNRETRQRAVGRGEDPMQLGATFVVDRGGVVRYAHRNRDVKDEARNDDVLASLSGWDR